MLTVNTNPSASDLKGFGWAMLIGFGLIGLLLYATGGNPHSPGGRWAWTGSAGQTVGIVLIGLGIGLFLLSRLFPAAARPVYVGWMSVTVPIGAVMTRVFLTVFFAVVLPPFSLLVRLSDPLRKRKRAGDSYWEDYQPHEATVERLQRPF
ncbi:MAG: hypothetical protein D6788_03705 [Planctomycetota bacterium]|nr:MAG: hypothetical protein D6788_03705 [Planctomycetota bacterium]